MENVMEEIVLDEDMESIENHLQTFHFPAVRVSKYHFYFNAAAKSAISESDFRKLKIFNTNNYVVFVPADDNDPSAFCVNWGKGVGFQLVFPCRLQNKVTINNTFKLYRYKDGLAFKKYEPLMKM